MKKTLLTLIALLCVVVQGSWAQEPTPSTALEPYITTLNNRMVYKFNYPSTSVRGQIPGRQYINLQPIESDWRLFFLVICCVFGYSWVTGGIVYELEFGKFFILGIQCRKRGIQITYERFQG